MPRGANPCQPGCTCKRHDRASRIDWSDPAQRRAYNRSAKKAKYAANPEPVREASRRWRQANPGRHEWRRVSNREWLYGVSPEAFARMLEEQDGRCYLGGELLDLSNPKSIHVDHDHDCCPGKKSCGNCIRGLACSNCNTGIGLFGDDPARMQRAAKQLLLANALVRLRREFGTVQDELPLNFAPLREKESELWQWKDLAASSTWSSSHRAPACR